MHSLSKSMRHTGTQISTVISTTINTPITLSLNNYNSRIRNCARKLLLHDMWEWFFRMRRIGIQPNEYTFASLMYLTLTNYRHYYARYGFNYFNKKGALNAIESVIKYAVNPANHCIIPQLHQSKSSVGERLNLYPSPKNREELNNDDIFFQQREASNIFNITAPMIKIKKDLDKDIVSIYAYPKSHGSQNLRIPSHIPVIPGADMHNEYLACIFESETLDNLRWEKYYEMLQNFNKHNDPRIITTVIKGLCKHKQFEKAQEFLMRTKTNIPECWEILLSSQMLESNFKYSTKLSLMGIQPTPTVFHFIIRSKITNEPFFAFKIYFQLISAEIQPIESTYALLIDYFSAAESYRRSQVEPAQQKPWTATNICNLYEKSLNHRAPSSLFRSIHINTWNVPFRDGNEDEISEMCDYLTRIGALKKETLDFNILISELYSVFRRQLKTAKTKKQDDDSESLKVYESAINHFVILDPFIAKKCFIDMICDRVVPSPEICNVLSKGFKILNMRSYQNITSVRFQKIFHSQSLPWGDELLQIFHENNLFSDESNDYLECTFEGYNNSRDKLFNREKNNRRFIEVEGNILEGMLRAHLSTGSITQLKLYDFVTKNNCSNDEFLDVIERYCEIRNYWWVLNAIR